MAFYEMLPGAGMPSGLQAGMDSVLNKKFGTSTTYPAEGWPDTVNLMGPLPEKTASGAIVTFADGADGVPLKKCEITLPASLDGYSEIDVVSAGKNLLPNTAQTATENGVTFTVNSDGSVSLSGTCNADTNFYIYSGFTFQKLGQYFFSGCPSGGSTSTYRVFLTNYGADVGSGYLLNVSNLSTTTSIRINIKSGVVTDGLIFKPMIEYGTTATTYETYTAPTTHTATLGRTIYGGTADIVNGVAEPFNIVSLNRSPLREKIDYGITINQQSESVLNVTTNGTAYSCERLFYSLVAGTYTVKFLSTSSDSYTPLISIYRAGETGIALSINPNTERTFTLSEDTDIDIRLFASGGGDTTIRTVEFSNFQLERGSAVHDYSPYFEPFTFDPVPIDSKLGDNTIWSDSGDTEVTYRADINLALGGN